MIGKKLEAKLLVESRNICNICWKSKEVQIHHIIQGAGDSEDNLIVVCLNCHSTTHTKKTMSRNLGPETLRLYKETWLDLVNRFPLIADNLIDAENDIKQVKPAAAHPAASSGACFVPQLS